MFKFEQNILITMAATLFTLYMHFWSNLPSKLSISYLHILLVTDTVYKYYFNNMLLLPLMLPIDSLDGRRDQCARHTCFETTYANTKYTR